MTDIYLIIEFFAGTLFGYSVGFFVARGIYRQHWLARAPRLRSRATDAGSGRHDQQGTD
jgi:hypothetical protein